MVAEYKKYMVAVKHPSTGGGPAPDRKDYYDLLDKFLKNDTRITGVMQKPVELGLLMVF